MPITISCPTCRASGQVPDEAVGHQVTCPVCGSAFLLQQPHTPIDVPDGLGVWVDTSRPTPPQPRPAEAPTAVAEPAPAPQTTAEPEPEAIAAAAWFQAEKERFDSYMAGCLSRLEQVRRDNAEAESRHEASCLSRSVELNHRAANLDAQRQHLERRETELRHATEALKAREEEAARRLSELAEREAAIAERESRKAALETEAAELSRLVAELRPTVERLGLRKTEAEVLRAELASKQSSLDRRLIEVGRIELALQKRITEFDEVECTLREELEEREAELERQRTMLMEEVRALRDRVSVNQATPMPRPSPILPALPPRIIQHVGE